MIKNIYLQIIIILIALIFVPASHAAYNQDRQEIINALRQILRDDPDIILDVLRDNSEMVLDIAQQGSNQRRLRQFVSQWKKELDEKRNIVLENRPVRGKADAPVTIIAFSDFTCPYCTQAAKTLEDILRENPDGVRLIFKHFPLEGHRYARLAAEYYVAASFQGQNKAFALYDKLFELSPIIADRGEPVIKKAAEEAGVDMKKLLADLRSRSEKIRSIIEEDIADGRLLGFQGTPNFLVNNLIARGALSQDFFNQAINMAYEHVQEQKNP